MPDASILALLIFGLLVYAFSCVAFGFRIYDIWRADGISRRTMARLIFTAPVWPVTALVVVVVVLRAGLVELWQDAEWTKGK